MKIKNFLSLISLLSAGMVFAGSDGSIRLTDAYSTLKAYYTPSETAYVAVCDPDLNKNSGAIETMTIKVTSQIESAGETITLTEASAASDTFRGSFLMQTSASPIASDGKLQLALGNNVIATYVDSSNSYNSQITRNAEAAYASQMAGGTIASNTVWYKANSPYLVTNTVTVQNGYTLSIEAGVTVLFLPDTGFWTRDSINVQGSLDAIGLVNDSIIFKSASANPQKDQWFGIYTFNGQLNMRYCRVQNARYGVYAYYSSLGASRTNILRLNTFRNNSMAYYQQAYGSGSMLQSHIDSNAIWIVKNDSLEANGIYLYYNNNADDTFSVCGNTINASYGAGYQSGSLNAIYVYNRYSFGTNRKAIISGNALVCDTALPNAIGVGIDYSYNAQVSNNRISGFGKGIRTSNDSACSYTGNIVSKCEMNVAAQYNSKGVFSGNAFVDPAVYSFCNMYSQAINARNNYWGTAATAEMNSGANPKDISVIFDALDTGTVGPVVYAGWLSDTLGTPAPSGASGAVMTTNAGGYSYKGVYVPGETLYVVVTDPDLNKNAGTAEAITVKVKSTTESVGENIVLTETGVDTATFKGFIVLETNATPVASDSKLQLQIGDAIFAIYADTLNLYGSRDTLQSSAVYASMTVSGTLSGNTTWLKANSPYIMTGSVSIPFGDTLTIQPGVVVKAIATGQSWNLCSLSVSGMLIANGIVSDSITFMSNASSPKSGDWQGVFLQSGGNLSMRYCAVRHARHGVYLNYSNVGQNVLATIKRSTFAANKTGAYMYFYNAPFATTIIDSNRIDINQNDSGEYNGIYIYYSGESNGDSLSVCANDINLKNSAQITGNSWVYGIYLSSRYFYGTHKRGLFDYNTIDADTMKRNTYGLYVYNGDDLSVSHNRISKFNKGIYTSSDSGNQYTYNVISACSTNFNIGYGSISTIHNNAFVNPVGCALYNGDADSIDARNNYWGAAATTSMNAGGNPKNIAVIYDYYDNPGRGKVRYAGWLSDTNGTPAPSGADGQVLAGDYWGGPKNVFAAAETVYVFVTDPDLNTNVGTAQSITVLVTSATESSGESVTLTEMSVDTAVFKGFIVTQTSATPLADGKLQAQLGESIVAQYIDTLNAYGSRDTLIAMAAYSNSAVSGLVSGTWYKANSPYVLTGTVTIQAGDTLMIQPGVRVLFAPDQNWMTTDSFKIQGTLIANGASNDSIVFSVNSASPHMKDWFGIYTQNADVTMRYCSVQFAQYGLYAQVTDQFTPLKLTVKHCTFKDNRNYGVYVYDTFSDMGAAYIDSNTITVTPPVNDSTLYAGIYWYGNGVLDSFSISDNTILFKNSAYNLAKFHGVYVSYRSLPGSIYRNLIRADQVPPQSSGIYNYGSDRLAISYNKIENFNWGYNASDDSGSVLTYNRFLGSAYAVNAQWNSQSVYNYNSFGDASQYAFFCSNSYGQNAQYNYWGPAATAQMNTGANPKNITAIFDHYENASNGTVNYAGFYAGPTVNMPPTITSIPPDSIKRTYKYTYQITTTDPNGGDSLRYLLVQSPAGMTVNAAGLMQWTTAAAGAQVVKIGVSDGADTVYQQFQVTVWNDVFGPSNIYTLTATAISDSAVSVGWTHGAGLAADADSIGLAYKTGAYPVSVMDTGIVFLGKKSIRDSSITVAGLLPKTIYYFIIEVRDSSGNWSTVGVDAKDTAKTRDLSAPANTATLTATAISETSVRLTFDAATVFAGTDVDSVGIWRKAGGYPATISDSGNVLVRKLVRAATACTATGLAAKTIYYFGLAARDSSGNWSNVGGMARDTAKTPDLTAPAAPTFTASGASPNASSIVLNWTRQTFTGTDVDSIGIWRKLGSFATSRTDTAAVLALKVPRADTAAVISGLAAYTQYYFTLAVRDSSGNWSAFSANARCNLYTQANPPANLTGFALVAPDSNTVNAVWNTPPAANTAMLVLDTGAYRSTPQNYALAVASVSSIAYTTTSHSFTGLNSGTKYYVSAFTNYMGTWNDTANNVRDTIWTPVGVSRPANITGLDAVAMDSGSIRVWWNRPPPFVDSILVRIDTGSYKNNPYVFTTVVQKGWNGVIAGDTDMVFSGLQPDSKYFLSAFTIYNGTFCDTAIGKAQDTVRTPVAAPLAPVITAVSPASGVITGGYTVTITGANFAAGMQVRFGTGVSSNVTVANATALSALVPPQPAGTVDVFVVNGTLSDTLINGFTYTPAGVNNAPGFSTTLSQITGTFAGTGTWRDTVSAIDPDNDAVTYTLISSPAGMTIGSGNGVIIWGVTSTMLDTTVAVNVLASDSKGGLDTLSFTITTVSVNTPPEFSTTALMIADTVYEYQAWSDTVVATDPDNDSLYYYLIAHPQGMTIGLTSGLLAWSVDSAMIGWSGTVVVQVSDSRGGLDTLSFTLAAGNTNDAPVILTALTLDSTLEDAAYTRSLAAYDKDRVLGDSLRWSKVLAPAGLTVDSITGTIRWTPGNSDVGAARVVSVRVRDKAGLSDTLSYSVRVINVNDAPVISTALTRDSVDEDVPYARTLVATDVDAGDSLRLRWKKIALPSGMTIDSVSGQLRWTPTNDNVGDTIVKVLVRDPAGASDTLVFSFRVINVNDAPDITIALVRDSVNEDAVYRLRVAAIDVDKGDTLVYDKLAGPAAAVFRKDTLVWSAPNNNDVGTHAIRLRVRDRLGAFDTLSFALVVKNTNDAPVFSLAEDLYVYYGALKVKFHVDDVDRVNGFNETLSYRFGVHRLRVRTDTIAQLSGSALAKDSMLVGEIFPLYDDTLVFFGRASDGAASGVFKDTIVVGAAGQSVVKRTFDANIWQLAALPARTITGVVPVADSTKLLYTWDAGAATYIPAGAGDTALWNKRGLGFWLMADQALPVTIPPAFRMPGGEPCSLALNYGWNMITSPYPYAVNFGDVVWGWTDSGYVEDTILTPWKGYFYYAPGNGTVVFDGQPYNPDAQQAKERLLAKPLFSGIDDFAIKVSVRGSRSSDNRNYAGVFPAAKASLDAFDQHEPPSSPNGGVAAWFEAPGTDGMLARDVRPSATGTQWWVLGVDPGADKGAVELSFAGVQSLPENLGVYFGEKNAYTDLRKTSAMHTDQHAKRYYSLVVTDDPDFIANLALTYELKQNWPNPFNPSTNIGFSVPLTFSAEGKPLFSKQRVSLKIFDIRGRLVRTLEEAPLKPGARYTRVWDGRENSGRIAASGMYVYKIEIGGEFVKSKKMVIVK